MASRQARFNSPRSRRDNNLDWIEFELSPTLEVPWLKLAMIALDRKLADNFQAGMTVGSTGGSQWVSGFTGQGFSNTVQAGQYGGYAQGPVYLDGVAG